VAVGAALACPSRKVIALEGDGSAMYTLQALWTMARESLDVTIVVFANRAYQILRGEFANVGAGAPGQRATDMLSLDRPALDWCALARGHGVESGQATDLGGLAQQLRRGLASQGPYLVELLL
jgi:acetolactate synthase-1/2/3 large subunit